MDGGGEDNPVQHLRSKTRVLENWGFGGNPQGIDHFPVWSFDGSSTRQSEGEDSDLILKPVRWVRDPVRVDADGKPYNFLVLCEVMNGDGTPHETNTRAKLRSVLARGAAAHKPWFGFEQEYTLFEGRTPLGWPEHGSPSRAQGPFYCGVGADEVAGRELVEAHLLACLQSNIMIYGVNAEVMLGQWEFQIGHRGFDGEAGDPLLVSDHLLFARWILFRLGEEFEISATLDCKPVRGDWNGAGCHTNFSTKAMRAPETGSTAIHAAVEKMAPLQTEHIAEYGHGLEARLTGLHETCDINTFKYGVADRGASVRIPRQVHEQGYGYLEDRRPGANADPYRVCARILETVCL
jgi:glutamine synthetase